MITFITGYPGKSTIAKGIATQLLSMNKTPIIFHEGLPSIRTLCHHKKKYSDVIVCVSGKIPGNYLIHIDILIKITKMETIKFDTSKLKGKPAC